MPQCFDHNTPFPLSARCLLSVRYERQCPRPLLAKKRVDFLSTRPPCLRTPISHCASPFTISCKSSSLTNGVRLRFALNAPLPGYASRSNLGSIWVAGSPVVSCQRRFIELAASPKGLASERRKKILARAVGGYSCDKSCFDFRISFLRYQVYEILLVLVVALLCFGFFEEAVMDLWW